MMFITAGRVGSMYKRHKHFAMMHIGVKVYTAAGQVINALASATALTLASAKAATFYSADGVKIRTQKGN